MGLLGKEKSKERQRESRGETVSNELAFQGGGKGAFGEDRVTEKGRAEANVMRYKKG